MKFGGKSCANFRIILGECYRGQLAFVMNLNSLQWLHSFVIHKISVGHKIRIIIEKMAKFYSFLFLCFLASFFLDAVNSAPTSSADSNSNEANNNSNAENVPNSDEPMSTENENDDNGENEIAKNDENMEDSGEPLSKEKESSENDEETNSDEYIDENGNETEKVDLLVQKKHIGDIMQLWDEDEIDGNMRNALHATSQMRWTTLRDTDGKYYIPYIINGTFNSQERQIIQGGMDAIDRNTCIRFKPRSREADYVEIQNKKDEGCYTTVGRLRGKQVLMLETGWKKSCGVGCIMSFPGCVDHGTVVHELMHKIGLWHEQMRYDRDNYIKIHWENIVPGYKSQFDKINSQRSTTFNVPYDFHSVMQYGKSSGAKKRNLITMETLDKRYQNVIGNAKDASDQDYRKICSIYLCSRCMNRAFTPLRSIMDVEIIRNNETSNEQPEECIPLNDDCDKGIKPDHSLYNVYCCPKCSECKPKAFCSVIDPNMQKSLHETFCCGRCSKN